MLFLDTTRVRQSRKERLRNNQTQDLNNEDLNVSKQVLSPGFIFNPMDLDLNQVDLALI